MSQERTDAVQTERITVHWGGLGLKSLGFELPPGAKAKAVEVVCAGTPCPATHRAEGRALRVRLGDGIRLEQDESLDVRIRYA